MTRKTDHGLTWTGWGLVGEPQDGVLVQTASGEGVDVTGYNVGDYWGDDGFLGPDPYGIVPIYRDANDHIFPVGAQAYHYNA